MNLVKQSGVVLIILLIMLALGVESCKKKKSSSSPPPSNSNVEQVNTNNSNNTNSSNNGAFCKEFEEKYLKTRTQAPLEERQKYVKECNPYYGQENYNPYNPNGGVDPVQRCSQRCSW